MKYIKKENIPLKHTIYLVIDTTEETGGDTLSYYMKHDAMVSKNVNIVLDGSYPVVYAEKGFGNLFVRFPFTDFSDSKGVEIIALHGSQAVNQIPQRASAELAVKNPKKIQKKLKYLARAFILHNGKNFKINVAVLKSTITVTVIGRSAHSSEPNHGVNPVSRLLSFLNRARMHIPFRRNTYRDAVIFFNDNFSIGDYGKKLGVAFKHPDMGPLTMTVTQIKSDPKFLEIAINIRLPASKSAEALKKEITAVLNNYKITQVPFDFKIVLKNGIYRDPNSFLVNTLLAIYRSVSGDVKARPVTLSGMTSAQLLPGALAFGPAYQNEKYMGHSVNEFKKLNALYTDVQMYTEMMLRFANHSDVSSPQARVGRSSVYSKFVAWVGRGISFFHWREKG